MDERVGQARSKNKQGTCHDQGRRNHVLGAVSQRPTKIRGKQLTGIPVHLSRPIYLVRYMMLQVAPATAAESSAAVAIVQKPSPRPPGTTCLSAAGRVGVVMATLLGCPPVLSEAGMVMTGAVGSGDEVRPDPEGTAASLDRAACVLIAEDAEAALLLLALLLSFDQGFSKPR